MQLLESSHLGVRSARLTFQSTASTVEITLFPMVHLGEAALYEAAYRDVSTHDAVLTEGVRSPVAKRITRSYRWIEGSDRIGLVVQPRLRSWPSMSAKIIHADLSTDEFELHWRKVPLHLKALLYAGAPLYALYRRWFGTRASLADRLALDDLPSRDEVLSWTPEMVVLDDAILTERDKRLVAVLGDYLDAPAARPRRLAVVYGAQHMRAVIKELTQRSFRCVDSRWMTVFSLDRDLGPSQSRAEASLQT
jgi:hypothetical protein